MNFTFDVADNTDDTFKASIVAGSTVTSSMFGSMPKSDPERTIVENLDDVDTALNILFPTIRVPFMGDNDNAARLHVLRGLSEGAMGKVFLARDSKTSRVFALKVFDKLDVVSSEELENTIAERCHLENTRENPFIIDLQASFQDETRLYLLLDFCAGGDLGTALTRWSGNMPIETATYIAAHLIEGISSLHAVGIIHRDIKPENILLTIRGQIKISDFGSAKHVNSSEQWLEPLATESFGTVAYLAPEIMAGDLYNSAIDWWSLGVIIYEMIVGEHPFLPASMRDEEPYFDMEDMEESICNGEYKLPNSLETSSRRIIKGFLRTNPERRYCADDARKSNFFYGWDWELVRGLKYKVPEPLPIHTYDVASNFDSSFTTMRLDMPDTGHSDGACNPILFEGFKSTVDPCPSTTETGEDTLLYQRDYPLHAHGACPP